MVKSFLLINVRHLLTKMVAACIFDRILFSIKIVIFLWDILSVIKKQKSVISYL